MNENILDVIRRDLLAAKRGGHDPEAVKSLQTIIGDLQRIDKDIITEEEFLTYLKAQIKSITNLKQTLVGRDQQGFALRTAQYEYILLQYLEKYQPPQLSEADIRKYFSQLVQLNPGITKGNLMKMIKTEFPGQYDGKVAANIAGEFNLTAVAR